MIDSAISEVKEILESINKENIYCTFDEIKEMLGIDKDYTKEDKKIIMCTHIAAKWVDTQLGSLKASISFKRVISLLYASYLVRTSVFESNTESESSVATQFKEEAEKLVKIYKHNHSKMFLKVNGEENKI
jgi:hypothetical protein